ncbi:MAG TPA: hypothetical protein VJY62_10925 [Bacteroidia bacterium]|nr:hypothetical protein [Bacteroidia bacterium]
MKNKFIKLLLLLFTLTGSAFAQDKQTIAIAPFSYVKNSITDGDLKRVEARVEKVINEMKRFDVVNRQDMIALDSERVAMKGEDFIDGRYIEQGKKLGAQLMVFGRINSTSDKPQGKDNANNYIATINLTIKIVDVTTTAEIGNTSVEASSGKNASKATGATKAGARIFDRVTGSNTGDAANSTADIMARNSDQAMSKAIENIEDELRPFLIETFPAMFPIAQVLDKKDNKVKTVLIAGGKNAGIKNKDKMKVVELVDMDVEGKKFIRKATVAELQVTKVEDENFSQCNVLSGGTDLFSRMESKAKLKAITSASEAK